MPSSNLRSSVTVFPGSPGPLSPVSTISNGPAPTIPSAPISPRSSIDNFELDHFNFNDISPMNTSTLSLQDTRSSRNYFNSLSHDGYGTTSRVNGYGSTGARNSVGGGGGISGSQAYGTRPEDRPMSAGPYTSKDFYSKNARDFGSSSYGNTDSAKYGSRHLTSPYGFYDRAASPYGSATMSRTQQRETKPTSNLQSSSYATQPRQERVSKKPTQEPRYPRSGPCYKGITRISYGVLRLFFYHIHLYVIVKSILF